MTQLTQVRNLGPSWSQKTTMLSTLVISGHLKEGKWKWTNIQNSLIGTPSMLLCFSQLGLGRLSTPGYLERSHSLMYTGQILSYHLTNHHVYLQHCSEFDGLCFPTCDECAVLQAHCSSPHIASSSEGASWMIWKSASSISLGNEGDTTMFYKINMVKWHTLERVSKTF